MATPKKALITGVLGQDGSYLSELLLEKGYEVYGLHRRYTNLNTTNITEILYNENFHLVEGDLCDPSSINKTVSDIQPDELYNLGAMSHVATSFNQPFYTFQVNTLGTLNCLEAIRHYSPHTRLYHASTSEMFGDCWDWKWINGEEVKCQDEHTQFYPRSPYAVSKLAAHQLVHTYRESYSLFACAGILFNHEGKRRGENFVTRKITKWIGANHKHILGLLPAYGGVGDSPKLKLGNINSYRDFGHAKDYVLAMWLMLQQDKSKDYVIATGETHTVKDFLAIAFKQVGCDWQDWVEIDPSLFRPAEVDYLRGDSSLARKELGWSPKISFLDLVEEMVQADIEANNG